MNERVKNLLNQCNKSRNKILIKSEMKQFLVRAFQIYDIVKEKFISSLT